MSMPWFKREEKGILTSTDEKIEAPDGLWSKCPSCKKATHVKELRASAHVCPFCGYHYKIGARDYMDVLLDKDWTELFANLMPADPLGFVDSKSYASRIRQTQQKTGLSDACRVAEGKLDGLHIVLACMDFNFIGGSMGSVVGEKIARAIQHCIAQRLPLVIVSKSGGARMMEGAFSLMQMAKTSAELARMDRAGLPYLSILTDPTTGGVTASFAMLGDLNIAEPGALIAFAGPRVIRETIGKDLPEGFQSAEFLLEHGFVDLIVDRRELKAKLTVLLSLMGFDSKA